MNTVRKEEGQSVIMVVLILVVLIALVALVLDIGNAYAQRRVVQNAADAAALAATRELARGAQVTTNRQVLNEAKDYAGLNGVDPNTVVARYFRFDPDTRTTADLGVVPNTSTRPPENATGVTVTVGKTFNTYLAPVIGHNFLDASAESYGQISTGACAAGAGSGLFPIAVRSALFDNERDNGKPTPGATYTIWDKDSRITPGNFGWLSWDGDASNTTLVANMHDTTRSGTWALSPDPDDPGAPPSVEIPGGPGVQNSSSVKAELNVRIADSDPLRPKEVLLPVYDTASGQGNNTTYHVIGFAWFVLTDYNFQSSNKWVEGYFIEDAVPVAEGGCLDFGTKTVKLRPPMDLSRSISGSVAYEYLKITSPTGQTTYPVDVVNVLDVSGSMDDYWGSGANRTKKINTARNVLVEFNNMLRPDLGDQAGLVKYPITLANSPTYYYPSCGGSRTKALYGAEVVQSLTSDIATVNGKIANLSANGWTPLAASMQKGFEAVLDPEFHEEDHIPIIILASDGMGNIRLDGKMTNWSGTSPQEPTCNTPASADAIDMANQTKASGVTLFTVGIGNFLTYVLEAMATPDSNPQYPHFLQASDPNAMQQIYDSLGERIINFGGECTIVPENTVAAGALVTLYKDGAIVAQTTANDAGKFQFNDVEPGTYEFSATITSNGITYDVFTNKVGGYDLTGAPTLEVGEDAGTYSINLALKTSNPPQCDL